MTTRGRTILFALAILGCSSTSARAESSERAEARKHFERGKAAYSSSDYETAIREFKESYRLYPLPELLFNVARSHEAMGQHEEAIRTYREYLRADPQNVAEVRARIVNLQLVMEKQRAEREQTESAREQRARQEERARIAALDEEQRRERRRRSRGALVGWITAGTGVAAAALGGIFVGLAKSKQAEAERAFKSGQEYSSIAGLERQGRNFGIAGPVLLAAGGAALVAGGVLIFAYRRDAASERTATWFAPIALQGGGALCAGGRF